MGPKIVLGLAVVSSGKYICLLNARLRAQLPAQLTRCQTCSVGDV